RDPALYLVHAADRVGHAGLQSLVDRAWPLESGTLLSAAGPGRRGWLRRADCHRHAASPRGSVLCDRSYVPAAAGSLVFACPADIPRAAARRALVAAESGH